MESQQLSQYQQISQLFAHVAYYRHDMLKTRIQSRERNIGTTWIFEGMIFNN